MLLVKPGAQGVIMSCMSVCAAQIFGSDRSPRRGNVVCVCVCPSLSSNNEF